MSLFQFGFSISSTQQQTPHAPENIALAASHLPDQEDTILGRNEYNQVAAAVVDLTRPQPSQSRSKRSKCVQYSGEDRAKIAKYSCEHGNTKALQHFSKEYPNLKESTLRNFKKAYQDKLKVIQRQEGNVRQVTSLESLLRGRPPLLLELDCKLISFVKNLRARGGVVTGSVISAAAKGLIRNNPSLHQRYHSFEPTRGWIQSIYRRCNFSRRAGTTTRPPVPRGMYEECKLSFLTDIDKCINKHNIPPELVLNADQTPSSYVSVGRMTMAEKNSKSVPIKGLTDKRNITLTFVISLAGEFLPMQVIYQVWLQNLPNGASMLNSNFEKNNSCESTSFVFHCVSLSRCVCITSWPLWPVNFESKNVQLFELQNEDCSQIRDVYISYTGENSSWVIIKKSIQKITDALIGDYFVKGCEEQFS